MTDYRTQLYDRYVTSHIQRHGALTHDVLQSRASYLQHVIREHFPPNRAAAIVDLGCGHGALVHFAHAAGYSRCTGVDTSAEQVRLAGELGISEVSEGDVLPTLQARPTESLDLVITFDVIEHLTKSELLALADEVHRVLKPAGQWLIHTPNGGSPFFGTVRYGDYTHEQAFTVSGLTQLGLARGFSKVRCYEETPTPHGLKSSVRWLLWKVLRSAYRLISLIETGASGGNVYSRNLLAIIEK